MLPLGELWDGTCRAQPADPVAIHDAERTPLCNLGYARDACPRFPAGDNPDAVRFAMSLDSRGAENIRYVIESGHYPYRHGVIAPGAGAAENHDDPLLARQALAYFTSYQRRIREASPR